MIKLIEVLSKIPIYIIHMQYNWAWQTRRCETLQQAQIHNTLFVIFGDFCQTFKKCKLYKGKIAALSIMKLLKWHLIITIYAFLSPKQVIYVKFCSEVLSTADTGLETITCLFYLFYYTPDIFQPSFSL